MVRWIPGIAVLAGLAVGSCILPLDDYDPRLGDGPTGTGVGSGVGGGGGTAGTGGTGGQAECSSPDQCPGQDTTCRFRSCDQGSCGMADADHGTPCTEAGGDLCDGNGTCVVAGGEPCGGPSECSSGFCADDVCCESACDGLCEACASAKTGIANGACAPIIPFQDPDGECPAPALGCDGARACAACGFGVTDVTGACPAGCDSCDGDTCVIDCSGNDSCLSAGLTCPAGRPCRIDCLGDHACELATITCPTDYACEVVCPSSGHRCENAVVLCSATGPCTMTCQGGDTCRDARLQCGGNACTAACTGGDFPQVTCGSACSCTQCS